MDKIVNINKIGIYLFKFPNFANRYRI